MTLLPIIFRNELDYSVLRNYITSLESQSEEKFFEETRVSHTSFGKIVDIVERFVGPDPSFDTLPHGAKYAVHTALHYLSNSSAYRCTGTTLGLPRSTAWKMTAKVIDALVDASPDWIRWPTSEEQLQISEIYENRSGIPGIIGAVDGCHVGVVPPHDIQSDYINRKMYHSMNIMAVATDALKFTFVSAGECGRHHDSFVFKNTELWQKVMEGDQNDYFSSKNFHLIGDSAFELHEHLLVPYAQPRTRDLTRTEKNFNTRLSRARACIENAFGFLKGRFRILKYQVNGDLDKAAKIMMACCVLHNICLDDSSDETLRNLIEFEPSQQAAAATSNAEGHDMEILSAKSKRDALANLFRT